MTRIRELKLRDVRCFDGEQSAPLGRRITLLVGENSAGKSTFMGCFKALAKLASFDDLGEANPFDEAPFHMGGFDSIVRSRRSEFAVGGIFEDHCYSTASFTFRNRNNLPIDRELQLRVAGMGHSNRDIRIVVPEDQSIVLRFEGPGFAFDLRPFELSFHSISAWLSRYVAKGYFPFSGDLAIFREQTGEKGSDRERQFVKFINFLNLGFPFPDSGSISVHALDPALPERARSYSEPPRHLRTDGNDVLFEILSEMGEKLQLWDDIELAAAPDRQRTEILVEMAPNAWHNLVDVGFGVHSLLSLLATIARQPLETVVLLQQPEVHVHPQAQATLAQWMVESGRSFMIETHSDHFVDRFRICVMKKMLEPDDLSIVYFHSDRSRTRSQIHGITVDDQGNLEGAPQGYRSFFLDEASDLLGFG